MARMPGFRTFAMLLLLAFTATVPVAVAGEAVPEEEATFDEEKVLAAAEAFFGTTSRELADVLRKVFRDQGRPNGWIEGEEAGGALAVGVRYGHGTLVTAGGTRREVYWQGPSLGFDVGGSAAKVFMLVYHLSGADDLFRRYPGVEGSLYFVGGVGVTYLQNGDTIVAPVRAGVGWRQGVNVGYLKFSRKRTWNPF